MVGPRGKFWPFWGPKTRFSNTLLTADHLGSSSQNTSNQQQVCTAVLFFSLGSRLLTYILPFNQVAGTIYKTIEDSGSVKESGSDYLQRFGEKTTSTVSCNLVAKGLQKINSTAIDRGAAPRFKSDEFSLCNPLVDQLSHMLCEIASRLWCRSSEPDSKTRAVKR